VDPIGYRITGNGNQSFEIVGIVKDSASIGLRDLDQQMMYVPGGQGVLHVRTAVPPATLIPAIEAVVRRLDGDVPIFNVRTIEEQVERGLVQERTFARLSGTFALLALVLSGIGLYGVVSNAVSRRTKEMGIRLALGAAPGRVAGMVVKEAGVLIAIGTGLGVPAALALGRALESVLFGVRPTDAGLVAGAVATLAAVAFVSAWIPARRAARVDPLVALKVE
jgi:ABC-type antimicrobial peptide transport system permease subunit